MPQEPHPPAYKRRIPEPHEGIQVNYCRNPKCSNFGVPPQNLAKPRGRAAIIAKTTGTTIDDYKITGGGTGSTPHLLCELCSMHKTRLHRIPIKSNKAIHEELSRLTKYLEPPPRPCCKNMSCPNHGVPITADSQNYYAYGRTKAGSQRFKCRKCESLFSVPASALLRQRRKDAVRQMFMEFRGKSPFRMIAENNETGIGTVYDKLDFFYEQALKFAAAHERKLIDGSLHKYRFFVGVDRQYFTFNWRRYTNRKNTIFEAIGSADNLSGYVFGMHLNFDHEANRELTQVDADEIKDHLEPEPDRKYARVMLREDYKLAVKYAREDAERRKREAEKKKAEGKPEEKKEDENQTLSAIQAAKESYVKGGRRRNSDRLEFITEDIQLPEKGLEVMPDYSIMGHFFFLRHLFQYSVHQVVFYLDRDSGFRGSMMSAFTDRIRAGTCEGFFVVRSSGKTTGEMHKILLALRKEESILRIAAPWMSQEEIQLQLTRESLKKPLIFGPYKDVFYYNPVPRKTEPERLVCHLTDQGQFDADQESLARLIVRSGRWGIDNFFVHVHRRFSSLERALTSGVQVGRKFYPYVNYSPIVAVKLMEIARVYYNYVHRSRPTKENPDPKTPAEKLGLAGQRYNARDIIYFK